MDITKLSRKGRSFLRSLLILSAFGCLTLLSSLMGIGVAGEAFIILALSIMVALIVKITFVQEEDEGMVDVSKLTEQILEVERLKRMRLDVNSITPILKLSLLEYDGIVTDVYPQGPKVFKEVPETHTSRREIHEYLGIVAINVKSLLGVDLSNVRFRTDGPKRITISGIKSEFHGMSKFEPNWILQEIRIDSAETAFKKREHCIAYTYPDPKVLSVESHKQLEDVRKRVEQGLNLPSINEAIIERAKRFLEMFLLPLGKELVFQESEDPLGVPLMAFIDDHNRELDSRLQSIDIQSSRLLK